MPFRNPNAIDRPTSERLQAPSLLRIRTRLGEMMSHMPSSAKVVQEVDLYNSLRLAGVPGVDPAELAALTVQDVTALLQDAGYQRED